MGPNTKTPVILVPTSVRGPTLSLFSAHKKSTKEHELEGPSANAVYTRDVTCGEWLHLPFSLANRKPTLLIYTRHSFLRKLHAAKCVLRN